MVLGAAEAQVPIIEKVRQRGFKVIVVSLPGNYPGFALADEYHEIDIRDRESVLTAAKQDSICGILTDQTDVAVPTVAYVAEHLGLPGIGYECSLRFANKYLMRQAAERLGVPVPRYFEVSPTTEAQYRARALRYPLIVKPVDSQGSRGVGLVSSPEELASKVSAARHFSREKRVIIEEFFEGLEVVVAGFASDYEFRNIVAGDRSYFDLPNLFIPRSTVFPWSLPAKLAAKVLEYNERLIRGLQPRFGITHSEFFVNTKSGEIALGETAIRGGGAFISSDLVPLSSGVDVESLLVEHATGMVDRVNLHAETAKPKAAAYFCFHLPEGVVTAVSGIEAVKAMPGVRRAVLEKLKVGWTVPPLTDKTGRLGPIIIAGDDRSDCESTYAKVKDALRIEVQTPGGVEMIRW